jgi:hypothetical protein
VSNLEFAGDDGSLSDINATQGEFRRQIAALNDLMRQIAGNAAVSPGDEAQVDPLNAPFTLYVNPYTGSDEFVGGAYNSFEEGVTEAEILASKVKRLEKQRLTCGFTPQRPFKTINRAVIEAAIITSKDWYSFTSRQAQLDCVSIILSTGVHKLYNNPGSASTNIASWGMSKDPTIQELIEFNPAVTGGVLLPRGVSLCAADLRKTSIRPDFVPAVADEVVTITDGVANYSNRTAMFKMTGTGYYFGFSIFDKVSEERSHHLLDAFAFASEAELDDFYAKTLSSVGDSADLANNLTVTRTTEFEIVAPIVRGETPTQAWDSTDSASPYIFNVSIRSNYGLGGAFIDGAKVGGLKSMVCANFTGVSLQKDMSCWQIYVGGQWIEPTYTEYIAADPDNVRMNPARLSRHISAINDAFIQEVSVFAIGQGIHHFCDTGGEITITNSNSSFGGCAAYSKGYKTFAFPTDSNWAVSGIKVPLDLREKSGNVRRIFLGTISEVTDSKITLVNELAIDSTSSTTPAVLLDDGYSFASGTFIWAENPLGDPWYAELATNAWEASAASEIDITGAFQGNDPTTDSQGVNLLLGKRIYIRRLVDTRNPSERRVSILANNTSSVRLPQRNSILQTDPDRTGGSIATRLSATGPQTFAVSNTGEHRDPGVTRSAEFTIRRSAPSTLYIQGSFYPAGTVVRANNKHFISTRDLTAESASPDPNIWIETFVHTESDYDAEDPITQEGRLIIIDFDRDEEPFSETLGINFDDVYNGDSYKSSSDYKGVNAFLVALGFDPDDADAALVPQAESSRVRDTASGVDFPNAPTGGAATGLGNWTIEFRRPSTLRLFAHAWEYTGFLNYSKAIPSAQQDLSPQNAFTYFFTNDGGGRVVPQGSNENGFNITPRGLEDIETGATLSVENIGSSSIEISQQTSFDELQARNLTVENLNVTSQITFPDDPLPATTDNFGVVQLATLENFEDASPAQSNAQISQAGPTQVVTVQGLAYWRQINNFLAAPLETPIIYVDPINGLEYSGSQSQQLADVFNRPPTTTENKIKSLGLAARYANAVYSALVEVEFRVGPGVIFDDAEFDTNARLRAWDYNANPPDYLNDDKFGGTTPFFGANGRVYNNYLDPTRQPTFATGFTASPVTQSNNGMLITTNPVKLTFNQKGTVTGFVWYGIVDSILDNNNIPDSFFPTGFDDQTIDVEEWRQGATINDAYNRLFRSYAVRTKQPPVSEDDPPEIYGCRTRAAVIFNDEGTLQNCAFGAMRPSDGTLTGGGDANQNVIRGTSGKVCILDGIRLIGNVKLSSENNEISFGDFDCSKIVTRLDRDSTEYRFTGFSRSFYGLGGGNKGEISLALGTTSVSVGGGKRASDFSYNNFTLLREDASRNIFVADTPDLTPQGSDLLLQGPAFEFLVNECSGLVPHGETTFRPNNPKPGELGGVVGTFGKYYVTTEDELGRISAGNFVQGSKYKIVNVGSTDFTLIGAANNNVGTVFIATGAGSGSGVADIVSFYTQGFELRGPAIVDKPQQEIFSGDGGTLFRLPDRSGDANFNGQTPLSEISNGGFDYFIKTVSATNLVNGTEYTILEVNDTDFNLVAVDPINNNVGDTFTATGPATGNGVVYQSTNGGNVEVNLGVGEVQENGPKESDIGVFPDLNIKLRGYEKGIQTTDARTVFFRNIF